MANINRTQGSSNERFKQIEGDSWSSIYLPAVCAGIVMSIVLFVAVACSKNSDHPASSGISSPSPAITSPAPTTAVVPEKSKKVKKHRPANATYVNGTYGVSFSYPRKYSLQAASKKSPVQTSLLKPGAIQIASVDMPAPSYPETDFSAALLNVSVNPGMSAEECAQFIPNSKDTESAKRATVKLGANEFSEIEQMSGELGRQANVKYFHLFKNGACYEFALDVETSRKADEELAQVDRGKVFQQLEKILTTARIKDVELPRMEKPVDQAKAKTPVADATTEKAQVLTPEQK
jgi:hypothetical protein